MGPRTLDVISKILSLARCWTTKVISAVYEVYSLHLELEDICIKQNIGGVIVFMQGNSCCG